MVADRYEIGNVLTATRWRECDLRKRLRLRTKNDRRRETNRPITRLPSAREAKKVLGLNSVAPGCLVRYLLRGFRLF